MAKAVHGTAPDDMRSFLDRELPALLGVVGTLRRDGSPHVVPVWYRYTGEVYTIWAGEERTWVQHLKRDNRVAFTVLEDRPPYAAVTVHGHTEVRTGDEPDIDDEIRRITRRYIQEPEIEAYVARFPQLRTIVTIVPESTFWWGVGY